MGIFIYTQTVALPQAKFEFYGPAGVPRFLAILMIIFGFMFIFAFLKNMIKKYYNKKNKYELKEASKVPFSFKKKYYIALVSFLLLFFYVYFLGNFGFIVITLLYLFTFILFIDKRKNILQSSLLAILITFALYYLFEKICLIYLPRGMVLDKLISLANTIFR